MVPELINNRARSYRTLTFKIKAQFIIQAASIVRPEALISSQSSNQNHRKKKKIKESPRTLSFYNLFLRSKKPIFFFLT